MKPLLIVGVDPGTTLGYAILDIDGNIVKLGSLRNKDIGTFITEVIRHGKPILVGTDKKYAPEFVKAFATKVGARLMTPEEDISVLDKKYFAEGIRTEDLHQRDALASAMSAYKQISPLLSRINKTLAEQKKSYLSNQVKETIILNEGPSIKEAMDVLEPKQPVVIVREIVKKERQLSRETIELYAKAKNLERESRNLREENQGLMQELEELKERRAFFRPLTDKHAKEQLNFKEKRIKALESKINKQNSFINQLQSDLLKHRDFVSELQENNTLLLKKLDTLGWKELEHKNNYLKIRENDVLLVANPNILSQNSIEFLKDKISIIVFRSSPGKNLKLPFTLIDASRLNLKETRQFALVEKAEFDHELASKNVLKRVLEEYKAQRRPFQP